MSTANAKTGSAIEPRAALVKTPRVPAQRPAPVADQDQGLLLAQFPDLDSKAMPALPAKRADGRILSQAMSVKLIFGVGFTLVVAAILPFIFNRSSRPETTVKELPDWSRQAGPMSHAGDPSQTTAPAWPSSPPTMAATAPQPRTAPEIVLPKPPQVGDARPTNLTEPAWAPPRSSGAMSTAYSPPPQGYTNPPAIGANQPDYRGNLDRSANPATLQADNRSNPATGYRNSDSRYDYRPEAAAPGRNVPAAPNYPRDNRYENTNSYPPVPSPGGALMPSNGAPSYRDVQTSEPGIARFDGTITPPPAR